MSSFKLVVFIEFLFRLIIFNAIIARFLFCLRLFNIEFQVLKCFLLICNTAYCKSGCAFLEGHA